MPTLLNNRLVLGLSLLIGITGAIAANRPAVAAPDDLLRQALARPAANMQTDYRFTQTIDIAAAGKERDREVMRFDPTKPPSERWTVLTKGTGASADQVMVNRESDGEDFLPYRDLADLVDASTLTPKGQRGGATVYGIVTKPGKAPKLGKVHVDGLEDLSNKSMAGELFVRRDAKGLPYVSGVTLGLLQPANAVIVDVKRLKFGHGYAPDPTTGKMLMTAFGMDMTMKALLLINVDMAVNIRHSDFAAVK
jgi:hypothetical protein